MSKRTQAISDEEIISALLSHGAVRAAADAAGLPVRTLYDRMSAPDFQALYRSARAEVLRAAVCNLNGQVQAAINTIAEIMTSESANPAIRLQAAQTILSNAEKFSKRLQTEETGIKYDKEIAAFDANFSPY